MSASCTPHREDNEGRQRMKVGPEGIVLEETSLETLVARYFRYLTLLDHRYGGEEEEKGERRKKGQQERKKERG